MKSEPDVMGKFGEFGGRYVPEMLMSALDELLEAGRPLVSSKITTSGQPP